MRDEFQMTRQGKQYVLFAGLLDEAHSRGLKEIRTELVRVPTEENGRVAIVKARVQMGDGGAFEGIGDASPENVGRNIVPHIIRMAETRAKARALRDACNVGALVLEDEADEPQQSRSGFQKAHKDQLDLLRQIATDLRGEDGPKKLEARIGHPLDHLSATEAEEWIQRLTNGEKG